MPGLFENLAQRAKDMARELEGQSQSIQREYAEKAVELANLKSQLDAAQLAPGRLNSALQVYQRHDRRLCPDCLIVRGLEVEMHNIPGTNSAELWECPKCRHEEQDDFNR